MSTNRPNERMARRPDWQGGVSLWMADGAEWYLPRPAVRVADAPIPGVMTWTIEGRPDTEIMPRHVDELIELARSEPISEAALCVAMGELAVDLLRLNYDLPVTRAAWLVADGFRLAGEPLEGLALAVEIHDVLVRPVQLALTQARRRLAIPVIDGKSVVGLN